MHQYPLVHFWNGSDSPVLGQYHPGIQGVQPDAFCRPVVFPNVPRERELVNKMFAVRERYIKTTDMYFLTSYEQDVGPEYFLLSYSKRLLPYTITYAGECLL